MTIPALDLSNARPQEILQQAYAQHEKVSISFSGAEDVVLIDMACDLGVDVEVFSLDTGRLHGETYEFIEAVREHYGVEISVLSPDAAQVQELVRTKGLFSFYQDGHNECCSIRKIAPLRAHMATLDAWITGQRKDQSPGTRADVPTIQKDLAFSTDNHDIMKYNPLANWTSAQVWDYIREYQVPYNKLHEQGYSSIGCAPCTRPVTPNQHERAGRWWWEEATKKECGLHTNK